MNPEIRDIEDLLPSVKSRKDPSLCRTRGCTNEGKGRKRCCVCRKKWSRFLHPDKDAYNNLLSSARKRKIPISITFDQFKFLCRETGYLDGKGREGKSLTIDRIESSKGYHLDNVMVIPHSDNSLKSGRDGIMVDGVLVPWWQYSADTGATSLSEKYQKRASECPSSHLSAPDGSEDHEWPEGLPQWLRGPDPF